jgi:trimethylamine--corrinoid protein Co-methyltransferase
MFKQRKLWTDDEARQVHDQALELMDKVGVEVSEKRARDDLKKAGCKVDEINKRVFIPRYIVEEALRTTPASFSFYDSFGERYIGVGGDEISFGPSGFSAYYLDWRTGEILPSSYQGLMEEAKLVEVLEIPNYIKTSVQPVEKPAAVQDLWMAKGGLVYTRKPVHTSPFGEIGARGLIEMTAEVMGGADVLREKPHLMFNICTLSPLKMRTDASEAIREAAKYKVPCFFTAGPMAGATAPVTLAGELTVAWAEILAHLVLQQTYQPGAPAIVASWSRIFDMRNAICTVGTPEFALMRAAITQLGRMNNVPTGGGGFLTDSNTIDVQYGWEKFMTGLATMQARMHTIWGLGMVSQMNLFSHEGFVIDCEIVRHVQRLLDGIVVDKEHLAFDLIAKEGGIGGASEFLKLPHTRKHYKTECMVPELTDRRTFQMWTKEGEPKNDIRNRARQKIEECLAGYNYTRGLEKEDALDKIIERYERLHDK